MKVGLILINCGIVCLIVGGVYLSIQTKTIWHGLASLLVGFANFILFNIK